MKLSTKHYVIIAAALVTAFLHLAAALDKQLFPDGPDPLFLLNCVGYFGLLGAYFLPIKFFQDKHKLVWYGFFSFAILTIVAWLVIWVGFSVIRDHMSFFAHDSLYGVPAKIAELILLGALWKDKA